MCLDLIRLASFFVSFSFPFFPFSFYFQWKLNAIEFWTKSNLIMNLILNSIYFMCDLSFLLPSFPFVCSSLPFSFCFFNCPFCSTFLFPFLSFPCLIIKMFQLSKNLSDNLAITFCWKRDPGGGIDSFDPNEKKDSTKKWTGFQHYATTLCWDLGSLMHFFIATNVSLLEPLVYIKYCLSSSEMRS